ncbi:hypothetical protein D3C72_807070 [compost metagenome]
MGLQAFDHRLDFCRGLLSALGQQTNLIRHNRETATLLTGPGSLDGGVEGQQVGLLGDGTDHFQNAADLGAFGGQRTDHFHGLIDRRRQRVDLLQAAVDVDLALLRLRFGIAHFTGGMLGVFRHVLHAVGHFIDSRGHQLHLLRLLLTALLGLSGVIAQFAGRLAEGARRHLQLTDHQPQLGGEGIEVPRQLRDFVLAVGVEAAGQVAFAAGDIGHCVHSFLQRADDAAGNQHHQRHHDQCDGQADQRSFPDLSVELGLHVIDVHARANHPAPRFEQFDVGGFLDRCAGTGLRPTIIDDPGAFALGDGNHFVEHRKTVRVADRRQVLAVEFGVGRVHDHHGRQIVDPEVIILVVTQAANSGQRLFLRGFAGQGAGGFQALVITENAAGGLHHMLGLLRLGVVQIIVDLLEHHHAQGQQHHDGHDQDEPQTAADRHIAQAVHNAVLRFLVLGFLVFVMIDRQHPGRSDNAAALFRLV